MLLRKKNRCRTDTS